MVSHQWKLEIFECLAGVDLAQAEICKIGGWVNEPFAIDRRWFADPESADEASGWMVTHLPTGLCCFGVLGGKDLALKVVDELRAGGNWDFVDPAAGKANFAIVRRLIEKYPEVRSPNLFDKALWLDGGTS